jgi:hypothetical protein
LSNGSAGVLLCGIGRASMVCAVPLLKLRLEPAKIFVVIIGWSFQEILKYLVTDASEMHLSHHWPQNPDQGSGILVMMPCRFAVVLGLYSYPKPSLSCQTHFVNFAVLSRPFSFTPNIVIPE